MGANWHVSHLIAAVSDLTQLGDANQAGSCNVGGAAGKLCESFSYDSLDRLDTVTRNGTQTLNVDYDLTGNITSCSDVVGDYSYEWKEPARIEFPYCFRTRRPKTALTN